MYDSDLSNEEWLIIQHHFNQKDPRGNAHQHSKKSIVDAILYVVKGGITWRLLPHDFPPWKTVYDHFRRWNKKAFGPMYWMSSLHCIVKKRGVNLCRVMGSLTHKALEAVLKLNH